MTSPSAPAGVALEYFEAMLIAGDMAKVALRKSEVLRNI